MISQAHRVVPAYLEAEAASRAHRMVPAGLRVKAASQAHWIVPAYLEAGAASRRMARPHVWPANAQLRCGCALDLAAAART